MIDTIIPQTTDYPGDEAFEKLLKTYACQLSFKAFKFRFWGQITSIAFRVQPMQEIQDIWEGKLPLFQDEKEAQEFFDVIFSLWNALAEMNMNGRRLPLSQRRGLDTPDGLSAMIKCRLDELDEGFLAGFMGDMRVYDEPSHRTGACLSKLEDLVENLESLSEDISDNQLEHDEARGEFLAVDKSAQRILDNLIKAANAERKIGQKRTQIH